VCGVCVLCVCGAEFTYYSLQNYICDNIYQDFIITAHNCIAFCHLIIHNFS
jgi:hypothetical protein